MYAELLGNVLTRGMHESNRRNFWPWARGEGKTGKRNRKKRGKRGNKREAERGKKKKGGKYKTGKERRDKIAKKEEGAVAPRTPPSGLWELFCAWLRISGRRGKLVQQTFSKVPGLEGRMGGATLEDRH